ncbi:MAG TPA: hypothetical protein VN664_02940 [Burkholderiales bacterium]|nr:hypothetical protein [Burkholderiales bacterium]
MTVVDILLLIGVINLIFVIFHTFIIVTNIKEDRKVRAALLGPFSLLFSDFFEEKANRSRQRLPWFLAGAIIFSGLSALLRS